MSDIASQIAGVSTVYSAICSGADQKKTSELHVIGLRAQSASNEENVSIWWRHHGRNAFAYNIVIPLRTLWT